MMPETIGGQATPPPQDDKVAVARGSGGAAAPSPERRAALMLVAVEGFSYAEAANVLGVPAGTLMSRIARGREDLRDDPRRRLVAQDDQEVER